MALRYLPEFAVDRSHDDWVELHALVLAERFARDQGDWHTLEHAYAPWAHIHTTWFEGTPAEFAEASRVLASKGRHAKHVVWPQVVLVHGDRAFVESYGEIRHREAIHGVEADMTQFCRFVSRAERVEGQWRLLSLTGIYQRDRLDPVEAGATIPLDRERWESLRPSYRVWAYTFGLKGYAVTDEMLGDDRPGPVQAFYDETEAWLRGA